MMRISRIEVFSVVLVWFLITSARADVLIDDFTTAPTPPPDILNTASLTGQQGFADAFAEFFALDGMFPGHGYSAAVAGAANGGSYTFDDGAGGTATVGRDVDGLVVDAVQQVTGGALGSFSVGLAYAAGRSGFSVGAFATFALGTPPRLQTRNQFGISRSQLPSCDLSNELGVLVTVAGIDPVNVGGITTLTLVDGDGDVHQASRSILSSEPQEIFLRFADATPAGEGTNFVIDDDTLMPLDGTGPLNLADLYGLGIAFEFEGNAGPFTVTEVRATVPAPASSALLWIGAPLLFAWRRRGETVSGLPAGSVSPLVSNLDQTA